MVGANEFTQALSVGVLAAAKYSTATSPGKFDRPLMIFSQSIISRGQTLTVSVDIVHVTAV